MQVIDSYVLRLPSTRENCLQVSKSGATLQRVLGKKTVENEILKEAVEYAAGNKWIARSPLLPGDAQ